MVRNEFTFPSADGRTGIHAVEWTPDMAPRAVLVLSHGVSEHILRYEPLAAYLTERGFAVAGHDHLGHGLSVAAGAPRLYFGPRGSWDWAVQDLYARRELAGQRFPGLPVFLLGHSMGSFLARTYLIRYPGTVAGAILMGTGQMPPALVAAGRVLAAREARKVGDRHSSPLVNKLAFEAYNQKFAPNRTGYDWLSASTENVDQYLADPLCGGDPTIGLFREMLRGIACIEKQENLKRMNRNTPVLFLSGQDDPVGDMGKGVRRAYRSFRRSGVRDVEIRLYQGLRHENPPGDGPGEGLCGRGALAGGPPAGTVTGRTQKEAGHGRFPMPGFLRSPQISQRQHCGISCPAQQLEGDHCVGGEHQQRGIGGGWRHGGQRRGYRRLDHRQPCCHQQAPGQGEGQADPAPQIPPDLGVVPEPHTQQTVIENVYGILHCCGRQTAPQGQRPEAAAQ